MKQPRFFIGIDISKLTMDVALLQGEAIIAQLKIENTESAIRILFSNFYRYYGCKSSNTQVCVESMGIYNTFLCNVIRQKKYVLCQESALQIKRSMGIQRGKSDAVDAVRIARYAYRNFDALKAWQPPRPVIVHLKELSVLRKRIKKARALLSATKKIETHFLDKARADKRKSYIQATMIAMQADIERLEFDMDIAILNDERLSRLMALITSIPRISLITGREILICTQEFSPLWTAKSFACHCGIAPFEYTSGTTVKGKSRVSFFANKDMKAALHVAAMGIVRGRKGFLYAYYLRKVDEGKNKMSVINAIRNKIIHRIFSCIKNDKLFVEMN